MAVVYKNSRNAVTEYTVLEGLGRYTFLRCRLQTGRTHQIRVHMSHAGHPVLGDKVYGAKKEEFKLNGQMLHARKLGFVHPKTGEYMEFETEIPERFDRVLDILRKRM